MQDVRYLNQESLDCFGIFDDALGGCPQKVVKNFAGPEIRYEDVSLVGGSNQPILIEERSGTWQASELSSRTFFWYGNISILKSPNSRLARVSWSPNLHLSFFETVSTVNRLEMRSGYCVFGVCFFQMRDFHAYRQVRVRISIRTSE